MNEGGAPIFVVGCARSGTTMLRRMLDANSELAVTRESHFIPALWRRRAAFERDGAIDAEKLAGDIVGGFRFSRWRLPEDAVWRKVRGLERPGFADVVEAVYRAYAEHHGKPRWGDKTPGYVAEIPTIAALFPEARFVHLLRDGRDVALSLLDVAWGPKRLADAAAFWGHQVAAGRRDGTALGPKRYLEVRYEDLIEETEHSLRGICTFAGLEFQPEMLRYYEGVRGRRHQARGRGQTSLAEPPTKGLRDWRRDLSPDDVALFEAIAGGELSALGYERAFPHPPLSARLKARLAQARTGLTRGLRRGISREAP